MWGSMFSCYERILPSIPKLFKVKTFLNQIKGASAVNSTADLDEIDWFGIPKVTCPCSAIDECVNMAPVELPNARLVSTNFFTDNINAEDTQVTHMLT